MKPLLLGVLASALASAHPMTAPPPQADFGLGGNAVPGVCLLAKPAVLEHSKIGIAATTRLEQIARDAQAEIAAARAPIEADRKAYQADGAKLTAAQRQQREHAIAERVQALEQMARQRAREIEATRRKAQLRILSEMQPVVEHAYQARGCGLLIDRASVLGGNMANDLTPSVLQGLDARITTISFDRESVAVASVEQPVPQ